jgi:hypothetical protein
MPAQRRTRVEVFLPVRPSSPADQTATDRLVEEPAHARRDSTLTTPFTGLCTSTARSDVIRDTITILFVDLNLDTDIVEHHSELTTYLDEIRGLLMVHWRKKGLSTRSSFPWPRSLLYKFLNLV